MMNSISYKQNSSEDIIKMPEMILITNTNQPLTTSTTMESINNTPRFNETIHRINEIDRKQKSLISIYDNNPQQSSQSLVGIIGRNKRSQAFTKRLLLSGFPKPILYDINSTEIHPNYVSYETFDQFSPPIVLLTENLPKNFEDLFPQNHQQLIIDTREIHSQSLLPIPSSYRAFGNLSNWEIENGTQRIGVAIEQYSPSNIMKFIHDLNCFPRGAFFLDPYSYNNQSIKSFRNCLFPFISTMIIFSFYSIFSIIEHYHDIQNTLLIYRQVSSITGSTSITLLALLFLIRPLLELIQIINENVQSNIIFIQRWLQSRRYLSWYSLSFALLHLIFFILSKLDFNSTISIYALFFGLLAFILLSILSFVHFPWISERLQWKEYHFLTSYLGPFGLLLAFIHLYLYWHLESRLFSLKFITMILPFIVLILRFIIYRILHPIQWLRN